jgi:hypothetical protein
MVEKKKAVRKKKVENSVTEFPYNPNRRCIKCVHSGIVAEKTGETGCKIISTICVNDSARPYYEERG